MDFHPYGWATGPWETCGAGIRKDAAQKASQVLDAVRIQPGTETSQELCELVSPNFAEH
jgi:hypothetical protein